MREKSIIFGFLGAVVLLVGATPPASGIAAWTRRYGAGCAMCHRPAPPRLSFFGHQFRKRGYRLPAEVGQKPDMSNIGHYVSMRNRFRFEYSKIKGGKTTDQFRWNDATLFFSGPITGNLSAFVELERPDEPELEVQAFGLWTKGDVPDYYAYRWGQMHTLSRVGWAGFDRPTAISTPWLLSRRLTTATPVFTIGMDQRGVEFQHSTGPRGRVLVQVLNGVLPGSSGGIEGTDDQQKDLLAAWEQAFNDVGSGFTLFAYRGSWNTTGTGPRDRFSRLALTGDWFTHLFHREHLTEVQGGIGFASDNVKTVGKTKGRAWYIDLEQYLAHDSAVLVRWDQLDPDRSVGGDAEHKFTLGAVRNVSDNLRLAIELTSQRTLKSGGGTQRTNGAVVEAMVNF